MEPTHIYAVSDPQFLRSMGVLLGPLPAEGNRVETLLNGDRIFPSMLQAIASARQTISFETYIYWSGDIGRRFAEALAERRGRRQGQCAGRLARQPENGQRFDRGHDAGGVDFRKYRPLRWYNLGRVNNRTHRKLWSSTVVSASPEESASPTTGPATHRTRNTGATTTIGSKGLRSRRCRLPSWTTGPR